MQNLLRAGALFILLIFSQFTQAQVRSSIMLVPMQSVNLADFDINNPASVPLLFTVTINNDEQVRNIRAEVTISGAKYGQIVKGTKYYRPMAANAIAIFNNKQFDSYKDLSKADFRETAESTGKLPADNYTFDLRVYDDSRNEEIPSAYATGDVEVENIISNPELISPGDNFDFEAALIYQKNPMFQWYAQANTTFDLAVYPVFDGQKNPEEVVLNRPIFKQQNIAVSFFQYPAYAEVLQDGRRYAWQVTAYTNTSKGRQPLYSNVYWFRIQSSAATDQEITTVEMSTDHVQVETKKTYQFNVKALNAENKEVNAKPVWEVVPSNMGHVDQNGLFTAGLMSGTAAVVAHFGDKKEYATIQIVAPANKNTPDEIK